jgi:hypothetical protein
MRFSITVVVLYSVLIASSQAQADASPEPSVPAEQTLHTRTAAPISPKSDWNALSKTFASSHGDLQISTTDHPGKKQKCRLRAITESAIICGASEQNEKSYSKDQISAVFSAHHTDHSWIPLSAMFFAGSGGVAYGAYVVGSVLAASIPLGIFAFILLYLTCMSVAFAGDESGDTVLYQAANNTHP